MLDFIDEEVPEMTSVEIDTGYGGLQLKDLLPKKGDSVSFVFPYGLDDGTYDVNNKYTGSDVTTFNSCVFWMKASDLNPTAKEAMGFSPDAENVFTRTFLCASKPTGNEWYKDLGYSHDFQDEKQSLEKGIISEQSYTNQRGGRWFNGNSVMPIRWFHMPIVLVEYSGRGSDRTFTFPKAAWLKLKGRNGPNLDSFRMRGQLQSLLDTFNGLEDGDEPSVYMRIINVKRTEEQISNYYTFSRPDVTLPKEYYEFVEGAAARVKETYERQFRTIFENQHGSVPMSASDLAADKKSNDNVRNYLVSITNAKNWAEFVEMHNIFATPTDVSELVEEEIIDLS